MFFKKITTCIALLLACYTTLYAQTVSIVTVEENNRLEDLADGTGINEWRFMTNAGVGVALEAEKLLDSDTSKEIIILVGKGYKGGNALWAGYLLLQKGYAVRAYLLAIPTESPEVCKKIISMFSNSGGIVQSFDSSLEANASLIIDGLVGTGFQGEVKGRLAEAIIWANSSNQPILAVDIPSGLNGNTGEVKSVAMRATHTIAISFPKIGFFIGNGWNYVGTISTVNIGLEDAILGQNQPEAYLISSDEASELLTRSNFLQLDRLIFKNILGLKQAATLQEYQRYSDENQISFMLTDLPKVLIIPLEKPMFIIDNIIQYRIEENGLSGRGRYGRYGLYGQK